MAQLKKYAFDTEFAPDGAIVREARGRLTPEQIEAARADAYEHGRQDSVAQAERQAAAALEALSNAAAAILTRLDGESRAMRQEAAHIALVAARKIAGEALDAFGIERAAAAIEAAMDTLRHHPRLIVKLSPDAAQSLQPRIAAMSETHAYAGAILVRAEPGMDAGEICIDWSDGIIAISPEDAAERIRGLIETALAKP